MTLQEFEASYKAAEPGLETMLGELEKKLEDALAHLDNERAKKKLPPASVRIRLQEARVKKLISLYRKVANDKVPLDKIFEPSEVRDLLAARVVCHRLTDVASLAESVRKDTLRGLQFVEPPKGKKDWLLTPNPDSGYRGLHLDVKWVRGGTAEFNYAELQIRTLLQDAWASIFHESYKAAATVFPADLVAEVRTLSDELHTLDLRAEELVKRIDDHRVYGAGRIRVVEAIQNEMYAMAAFGGPGASVPKYRRVRRRDRYVVAPSATYDFEIDAECPQPRRFRFPIGGDTDNSNFKLLSFEHIRNGKRVPLSDDRYRVEQPAAPNRTVILVDNTAATRRHHYGICCTWEGVFDTSFEYIWCPWASLYGSAEMDYELQLEFLSKPADPPRLLRVAGFPDLHALTNAYLAGEGSKGKEDADDRGHWLFSFQRSDSENLICFFVPS